MQIEGEKGRYVRELQRRGCLGEDGLLVFEHRSTSRKAIFSWMLTLYKPSSNFKFVLGFALEIKAFMYEFMLHVL